MLGFNGISGVLFVKENSWTQSTICEPRWCGGSMVNQIVAQMGGHQGSPAIAKEDEDTTDPF
jgi:hypothetical protein